MGCYPDNGGNPAVKDGLPDIFGLAHGEGGAFILKGSALVLGKSCFDNTFPLGGVVGLAWHGGSTPFIAAVCPLTNRRKTGCKSELFLKNPKKYLRGIFQRRKPQKAGLGWQPQQVSDRGTNERKAKFGTLVDTCSP